jgi:hypothetical protein
VHEYKAKVSEGSWCDYEIAECFLLRYDQFIWLCNHITERNSGTACHGDCKVLRVAMFYSTRADNVLLLADYGKIAVLYNAGQKVELRPNNHASRALRAAVRKAERLAKKLAVP